MRRDGLVPPGRPGFLCPDSDEVGRSGDLSEMDSRWGGVEPFLPGSEFAEGVSTDFRAGGGNFMNAAVTLRRKAPRPSLRETLFPESVTDSWEWGTDVPSVRPRTRGRQGPEHRPAVRSSAPPRLCRLTLGHSVAHVGHGQGLDPLGP